VHRYLFTGHASISEDNALDVLLAADKYLATPLIDECLKIIRRSLSSEGACAILSSSMHIASLIELCDACVCARAESVLPSDAFTGLREEHVLRILRRDDLRCEESVVTPLT